jgi:hypothetical protein
VQTVWNLSDELLDQCISVVREQGCTVEDCLAAHPAERGDLEPLLYLADRLHAAQSLQAPGYTRAAIQQRLRFLPARLPARRRSLIPAFLPRAWLRFRLAPLLAAVLLVVMVASSVGIVAVSAQALPGDFLYPVKRVQESLALGLALNESYRADLQLEFASRRMDEAITLSGQNRAAAVGQSLTEYNDLIQVELDFLNQSNGLSPSQQTDLANKLLADLVKHEASLNSLAQNAPQAVRETIARAMTTSQAAHNQAAQIIRNGSQVPPAAPTATSTPVPTKIYPTRPPTATPLLAGIKPTLAAPTGPGYPPPASSTPGLPLPSMSPPPNNGVIGTPRNTPTLRSSPTQWMFPTLKPPTLPPTKPPVIATRITPKPNNGLPTRSATPHFGPRP